MNKKETVIVSILTVMLAIMDITGLPGRLFIHIKMQDIDPVYFALMVNFLIIGAAAAIVL